MSKHRLAAATFPTDFWWRCQLLLLAPAQPELAFSVPESRRNAGWLHAGGPPGTEESSSSCSTVYSLLAKTRPRKLTAWSRGPRFIIGLDIFRLDQSQQMRHHHLEISADFKRHLLIIQRAELQVAPRALGSSASIVTANERHERTNVLRWSTRNGAPVGFLQSTNLAARSGPVVLGGQSRDECGALPCRADVHDSAQHHHHHHQTAWSTRAVQLRRSIYVPAAGERR